MGAGGCSHMISETVKGLALRRCDFSNVSLWIACQQSAGGLGLPLENSSPPLPAPPPEVQDDKA